MEELKELIIEKLCDEYSIEEAIEQVNLARITVNKDFVKVVYDNGVVDLFKLIPTFRLELIS